MSSSKFATLDQREMTNTETNNSSQILDSVARASKNGFLAYNLENKITCFSFRLEEITGWHESEMLGKSITELYSIKEKALLKNNTDIAPQIIVLYTRDGKQITLETQLTTVTDSNGEINGYLCWFMIEDYNKTLDRAQSEFISTVSHELRTPITSIKGFASTLLHPKQKLDEEKQKKYITIIKDQAERLSRLVEDLLAVSRLESKKLQLTIHPVKIKPIVEDIVVIIQSKYNYSHKITVSQQEQVPDVWVDSDRLEQILTNLIDNAVKYSPGTDKVDIRIKQVQQEPDNKTMVAVEITDYGIGIDKENLRKIFTKFSRLDNHLTRKTEGTGLGLYISHSLAKLLGGDLKVNSGNGQTTFTLYLSTESHEGGTIWWD